MITKTQIHATYNLPLMELMFQAHQVHREHQPVGKIELARLISIKTGGCPEDCGYCGQSSKVKLGVNKTPLMAHATILAHAKKAKAQGATRFCMGAAFRSVKDGDAFDRICDAARAVNELGLQVCTTLGMLTVAQARKLKDAGVHAYNHNLDTSREHYPNIVTTRTYDDRLNTLQAARDAGLTVCTGGILGLNETFDDRISLLCTLANLSPQPESVTINTLAKIPGTQFADAADCSVSDLVRTIACARIFVPHARIRFSAGRRERSTMEQLLCFYVGANSIFIDDSLLLTRNVSFEHDQAMLQELGLSAMDECDVQCSIAS